MAKRKDGLIEKTLTLNGQRIHVYGHTQAEIRAKMERLREEAYKGALGLSRQTTFKDFAEHWLDVYLVDKSDNTKRSYTRAANHLIDLIGNKPLGSIKRSEIEKALNEYADKVETRNRMRSVCRMIYNMAVDDGIVLTNPAQNIKKLKGQRKERHKFTERETAAILNCDLDDTERLMVDILYYTGVRKGELMGLSRKSIGDGVIYIREQWQYDNGGAGHITPILKTQASRRDIPIPSHLQAEIKAYMKAHENIYIFGDIMSKRSFNSKWMHIIAAINKELRPGWKAPSLHRESKDLYPYWITPHEFRHNYCSMLYENGIDVQVAKKLLGHSSIQTTMAVYTHLSEGKIEDDMAAVRGMFEEKTEIRKAGT